MTQGSPSICVLPREELEVFLERFRHDTGVPEIMDVGAFIHEVLHQANAFVPAEAGSVLLDNPFERAADPDRAALYFVGAFGPTSHGLLGASIPAHEGVVGHVYRTGQSHLVADVATDGHFSPRFDEAHNFASRSVLAVPIRIEARICGVIELINRLDGSPFSERDRALIEIFAAYTSVSLQTLLDARRAEEAARSDDLTGLANDRHFHRRLAQDMDYADAAGGKVALLFMDLDNFKTVNDTHGHLAGSQVLKEVGYLMRVVIRRPGVTLARYGGDEFVVILPGCGISQADKMAEAIRKAIAWQKFLRGSFSWSDGPVDFRGPLTCSVGVAVYPDHVPRSGTSDHRRNLLLRAADLAMYQAKAEGKNRVVTAETRSFAPK